MKKFIKLLSVSLIIMLLISLAVSAASTNTILTRSEGEIKCSVYLNDISKGSVIVVSSFKDGKYSASQLRDVTDKSLETFFIDSKTNEVTVLVFEDITVINPVTEGERIEVKLDSITDPDWSEWV